MTGDRKAALSLTPEHSWAAAAGLIFPLLRPSGTAGRSLDGLRTPTAAAGDTRPLLDPGPVGLQVVYAIRGSGYDILVNGDHLAAWNVPPARLRATAVSNLRAWSRQAPWTEERNGDQVVLSSTSGDGWDAARILLAEARAHLSAALAPAGGRVVVGMPTADLLVATGLVRDDPGFAVYLARFVEAYAAESDDPIDNRLFELKAGELAVFAQ